MGPSDASDRRGARPRGRCSEQAITAPCAAPSPPASSPTSSFVTSRGFSPTARPAHEPAAFCRIKARARSKPRTRGRLAPPSEPIGLSFPPFTLNSTRCGNVRRRSSRAGRSHHAARASSLRLTRVPSEAPPYFQKLSAKVPVGTEIRTAPRGLHVGGSRRGRGRRPCVRGSDAVVASPFPDVSPRPVAPRN